MNRPEVATSAASVKFLTVAALYVLPMTIGLRSESSLFSPSNILMLALDLLAVSRIMNIRAVVAKKDAYHPSVMFVDLVVILILAVMFHCLARPFIVSAWLVDFDTFRTPILSQPHEPPAIRNTWLVFWVCAFVLFISIAVWTHYVRTHHRLKRVKERRYEFGWVAGLLVSLAMSILSALVTPQSLYVWYGLAAMVGLGLMVYFFVKEINQDELYEAVN